MKSKTLRYYILKAIRAPSLHSDTAFLSVKTNTTTSR